MELPKELKDEVWEYARVNDISNIDAFNIKLIKQGFLVEKFGSNPISKEKEPVIIEKVVEKTVEVVVEKVITDDIEIKKLADKIITLEEDLKVTKLANEEFQKIINDLKKRRDMYGE